MFTGKPPLERPVRLLAICQHQGDAWTQQQAAGRHTEVHGEMDPGDDLATVCHGHGP